MSTVPVRCCDCETNAIINTRVWTDVSFYYCRCGNAIPILWALENYEIWVQESNSIMFQSEHFYRVKNK